MVILVPQGMQQWQLEAQPIVSGTSEQTLAPYGCFQSLTVQTCGTWGQTDG